MTKLIYLLLLVLISPLSHAQVYKRSQLDSLKSVLFEKERIERIDLLLDLSLAYLNFQCDTAAIYKDSALMESLKSDYSKGICQSYFIQSGIDFNRRESTLEEITIVRKKCADWFEENGYKREALVCKNSFSGALFHLKGRSFAFEMVKKNLKDAQELGDVGLLSHVWMQISKTLDPVMRLELYPGSSDSAKFYLNQSKDSSQIINYRYEILYNRNSGMIPGNELDVLKRINERWNNPQINVNYLRYTASPFMIRGNVDSTQFYVNHIKRITEDSGNDFLQGIGNSYMAFVHFQAGEYEQAMYYYEELITFNQEFGDLMNQLQNLRGAAECQFVMGNYEKAIEYVLMALNLAYELREDYSANSLKRKLAELYSFTDEPQKAVKLYEEVIHWTSQIESSRAVLIMRGNAYDSFAKHYVKYKQYEEALENYKLAFNDFETMAYRLIVPKSNLLAMFLDMKDTVKSDSLFTDILDNIDLSWHLTNKEFLLQKGRLMNLHENYGEAVSSLEQFINMSNSNKVSEDLEMAYYELQKSYKGIGAFEAAHAALETHSMIKDSLNAGRVKENVIKIQSEYEISLREAEIKDLQQQKELSDLRLEQQNNQLQLRQLYIIVLVFGFLVLGLIGYLLFRRFRFKKEEEKKEMETRLELENFRTRQKAELAEVKNTLFANISHEFRTPLTLIQIPIKEQLKKSAEADKSVLEGVVRNADNLLKMVDELLDLSKMESGTVELQKSVFDLGAFLSQIKSNFVPLFKNKGIDFKWNSQLTRVNFEGDENRLKIVLNNILKNAYSHTPENGNVSCEINVTENNVLKVAVQNSGSTIDAKDLPHIFERYYRAKEDGYSGTGIGLALSRQIVEMHGGTITANNLAEDNVIFEVHFPQGLITNGTLKVFEQETDHGELAKEEAYINGNGEQEPSNQPHIVVVEDNSEMRGLLNSVLKDDFKLDFAEDGEEGETLSMKLQPDLILSDVMMPKKDGFELLSVLKQNFGTSHIPVILLTARADSASRISGLDLDADDYVGKPFDPIELKARINNLLRQRKKLHKLFSENPLIYVKDIKCTPIDAAFLKNSREVLENHFADGDFSVNEFCSEMALNRNSVNNKLKALANQSTAEYIKNFRLEKAVKLLIETDLPMTDVYIQTGFNSPQAFNKVFKKKYGCTPSEYRMKKRPGKG